MPKEVVEQSSEGSRPQAGLLWGVGGWPPEKDSLREAVKFLLEYVKMHGDVPAHDRAGKMLANLEEEESGPRGEPSSLGAPPHNLPNALREIDVPKGPEHDPAQNGQTWPPQKLDSEDFAIYGARAFAMPGHADKLPNEGDSDYGARIFLLLAPTENLADPSGGATAA